MTEAARTQASDPARRVPHLRTRRRARSRTHAEHAAAPRTAQTMRVPDAAGVRADVGSKAHPRAREPAVTAAVCASVVSGPPCAPHTCQLEPGHWPVTAGAHECACGWSFVVHGPPFLAAGTDLYQRRADHPEGVGRPTPFREAA